MSKTFADLLKTVTSDTEKIVGNQLVESNDPGDLSGGRVRQRVSRSKVARTPHEKKNRVSAPSRNVKTVRKRARTAGELKTGSGMNVLADLRKRCGVTQVQLAETLGMKQPSVAQFESQRDACISTLRQYLRGLGLELEISVMLGDQRFILDEQYNK
ncbi:MAG: helix-turn-helix transcriptional regulator [Pseudomonadales bacterium]|nr:helix-turn-helix transcriptional regulator [Pseudomonadales bacterium]